MLVTDLSQSRRLQVLSTDRLYQILKELNRLDERITSFEVVREVAERANVGTALLGSFMRSGDTIRISVKVQEAASGKILASRDVRGEGQSRLFAMVDDLSRGIRQELVVSEASDPQENRYLEDVTTSSIEAYRHYSEGMRLHLQSKEEEAIELFKKAAELDPGFAMALARLSTVYGNLQLYEEAEDYAQRALEHKGRLTTRERYYIEGRFYGQHIDTWEHAIATWQKAADEYPHDPGLHSNLGVTFLTLGRYEDAVQAYEEAARQGETFEPSYTILAASYFSLGEFQKGHRTLQKLLDRNPESWWAHASLGWYLARRGRLGEALEALHKAESLRPGDSFTARGRWQVHCLRGEWEEAEAVATELAASSNRADRALGLAVGLGHLSLFAGRSKDALELTERAIRDYPHPDSNRADLHNRAAMILLSRGEAARALEHARRAQEEGRRDWAGVEGLYWGGLAETRLGRSDTAARTANELKEKTDGLTGPIGPRFSHLLAGELALARGDTDRAIAELKRSQSTLPPRAFFLDELHIPIWSSLASAHLAAGHEEGAAEWFQKITECTYEHLGWPVRYVRSFYELARIHENRGEREQARALYQRFADYWGNGDLDREQVEDARRKLGQLGGA